MADIRRSKRLSFWLQHAPQAGSLILDQAGWAATEDVLRALASCGLPATMDELEQLVATSDKQRFELSPGNERIRARQGHSVAVQGDWPIANPPAFLFHGTAPQFVAAILNEGLRPGRRHHVHLSSTIEAAAAVGMRRGTPVILEVDAGKMVRESFVFRLSSNGVWLAEHVPPAYLRQLS